ncbi:EF-P 5-aminopentanol modification-associated protein YfmF [Alkalicoccus urumqiensis]|uniref:EF-P 5-aminopentanol modification-associated protein YfmF n=1 Tax=Alkalicoccus urumqiensis TaxID=1548213 RepID=UPI001FE09807|nr:pitrilysin family protein [Alkalicoccus urumqiensis]
MQTFTSNTIQSHVFTTKTYKTNTIILQLRTPLTREHITEKALLPSILERGTEHFPTRAHVQAALEDLYGASLTADVVKKGEHHVTTFRLEAANEKFLTDAEPLTERAFQLLASVLLHPNLEENAFPSTSVEEEKRSHRQQLRAVYDDKMRYANKRLAEEMCRNEAYSIPVLGYEEDLEQLSPESIYHAYTELIRSAHWDLYVVGDIEPEDVRSYVEKYMKLPAAEPADYTPDVYANAEESRVVKEAQQVQQSKLHIGYRTGTVFGEPDYFALQTANTLFGGAPHSKLFVNVREKASLAYYAASRLESHKGIMIVMAGIDESDYDQAVQIIDKQLEAVQAGDFTDEDIDQTKAVLKNQILETLDVPRGRVELEYQGVLTGHPVSAEQWMLEIDKVTKEDIVRAAGRIVKDTTYFLHGKEHESA